MAIGVGHELFCFLLSSMGYGDPTKFSDKVYDKGWRRSLTCPRLPSPTRQSSIANRKSTPSVYPVAAPAAVPREYHFVAGRCGGRFRRWSTPVVGRTRWHPVRSRRCARHFRRPPRCRGFCRTTRFLCAVEVFSFELNSMNSSASRPDVCGCPARPQHGRMMEQPQRIHSSLHVKNKSPEQAHLSSAGARVSSPAAISKYANSVQFHGALESAVVAAGEDTRARP